MQLRDQGKQLFFCDLSKPFSILIHTATQLLWINTCSNLTLKGSFPVPMGHKLSHYWISILSNGKEVHKYYGGTEARAQIQSPFLSRAVPFHWAAVPPACFPPSPTDLPLLVASGSDSRERYSWMSTPWPNGKDSWLGRGKCTSPSCWGMCITFFTAWTSVVATRLKNRRASFSQSLVMLSYTMELHSFPMGIVCKIHVSGFKCCM